jgi:hypothetical protein
VRLLHPVCILHFVTAAFWETVFGWGKHLFRKTELQKLWFVTWIKNKCCRNHLHEKVS